MPIHCCPLPDYVSISFFSFYIDNLADYCSEENWSDYPGRHQIRLEKSLIIRRPSIVDFHYNDTHRQHLGGGSGRGRYGPRYSLIDSHPSGPNFVPYCLLSFTADFGHRIFAEGFATGEFDENHMTLTLSG